jgi:hypothetical protein
MRSMILLGVSIKHSVVAYLYMDTDRGFFVKEGIELKLVQIPGSLARKALLARQLDGMEFGNEGTSGPATWLKQRTDHPTHNVTTRPSSRRGKRSDANRCRCSDWRLSL